MGRGEGRPGRTRGVVRMNAEAGLLQPGNEINLENGLRRIFLGLRANTNLGMEVGEWEYLRRKTTTT